MPTSWPSPSFYSTASKLKNVTLTKVIIYKASSSTGPPPAACLSAVTTGTAPFGVSGVCNVYNGGQVAAAAAGLSTFNFSNPANCTDTTDWDHNWCWSARNLAPATADYLGVYAEYKYTGLTTVLPARTITLSDYTVYRMEPDV